MGGLLVLTEIDSMAAPDHNTDLYIYAMVLNRLPFIQDTPKNTTLISNYTLEVMMELDVCFHIDKGLVAPDPSRLGKEEFYSIAQRAIIADIVCCYILMIQMITASVAGSDGVPTSNKFLSKAGAGSTFVEWQQLDVKKGGLHTAGADLLAMYKNSAIRKAHNIGCIIDICGDCTTMAQIQAMYEIAPFQVVTVNGCGCCGDNYPERG